MHDLVIRNAHVYDGTGGQPFIASVAVQGQRIAAIGNDLGPARQTVDADGLALMPGIIDGHTHYDAQLTWDARADPSPEVGVTTVVIGNCGFTIAPCRPEHREMTMHNLTQVEGMSLDALRGGIRWDFESVTEYMDMLERRGVGLNVAGFVGHSAVRTFVMGAEASERIATDEEIAQMAAIVRDAMASGAVGFSTSTNEAHNGSGGVPMPSRLADDREMTALAKAMAAHGKGLFMITKGQKTSVPYLERIAADCARPVLIAPFNHNNTNPARVFEEIEEVRSARARGNRLTAQVSCLPVTFDFSLKSAYVFEGLDSWKPAMKAKGDALRAVYADAGFRSAVQEELVRTRGKRLFNSEWDKMQVFEVVKPENRALEGRSIADLAAAADKTPLDYLLDFALSEDLDTLFTAQMRNTDEAAVTRLINFPEALVALSDAGAHLTFLCDAGYGLHLLGHWARDRRAISMQDAVHKLTAYPAHLFGIKERGAITVGYYADLLLFDPTAVARGPNTREFDLPANAQRQRASARGVQGVWVNGSKVVDENGAIGDAPLSGQFLREFAA